MCNQIQTIAMVFMPVCIAVTFMWSPLAATPARAALITAEQMEAQERTAQYASIRAVEEHFKLVQMAFIRYLEARVQTIEAQIDANS